MDLTLFSEKIERLKGQIAHIIVGQEMAVDMVLTSMLADGHVLIEGVPGVAKTLLARLIAPVMTEQAVAYLSLIGAILIFCVGVNLVWGKKIRVANMLPAVLFAVAAAYLPWEF